MRLRVPNVIGRTKTGGEIRRSAAGNVYRTKGKFHSAVSRAKTFTGVPSPVRHQVLKRKLPLQGAANTIVRRNYNMVSKYEGKVLWTEPYSAFVKYDPRGRAAGILEVGLKRPHKASRNVATEMHITTAKSSRGKGYMTELLDYARARSIATPPKAFMGGDAGVSPAGKRFFRGYIDKRIREKGR